MKRSTVTRFLPYAALYAAISGIAAMASFECVDMLDPFDNHRDVADDTVSVGRPHPSIGDYHVYYGNFHNHSVVSDGQGTPEEAYRYARYTAGLDFFSLSDHDIYLLNDDNWNMLKAVADAANEDGAFTAFRAFEWTNFDYHITVINTDTFCINQSEEAYDLKSLCAWLDKNNGIGIMNHAFIVDFNGPEFDGFDARTYDKVVGMELFNQKNAFTFYYYKEGFDTNDNHKGVFDEALTRGFRVGAAGGFDDHTQTWGTATDFRLAILAKNLTRADLFSAMQARRFFSTLDKNIALSFTIGGCEMGSTVTGGNRTVEIRVSDGDGEYLSEAVLFDEHHVKRRLWKINTRSVALSDTLNITNGEYYYVKITQNDGDEAISSPIWVTDAVTTDFLPQ